ncbi:uncharacterized protein LOC131650598 [Vicia villosa]|uniref:uncharacterized protein LOC131650598 n=1 Tax=Vicia villosa TaxID=3911 RepID=UPI00273C88F8|nr:uncharacterized protein LOC131650598 [Vicia villosa]
MEAFPELYAQAADHLLTVAVEGQFTGAGWVWNHEELFLNSQAGTSFLWQQLLVFLQQFQPMRDAMDTFKWTLMTDGCFSVKTFYDRFKVKLSCPTLNFNTVLAINHLWKVNVPSKILCFGRRVILNRISTKDQLHKKGITAVSSDLLCVFCSLEEESLSHILRRCVIMSRIWRKVYEWMRSLEEISLEEFEGFFAHCEKVKSLARRYIVAVIWLASVWSIWLKRNVVIFNG